VAEHNGTRLEAGPVFQFAGQQVANASQADVTKLVCCLFA